MGCLTPTASTKAVAVLCWRRQEDYLYTRWNKAPFEGPCEHPPRSHWRISMSLCFWVNSRGWPSDCCFSWETEHVCMGEMCDQLSAINSNSWTLLIVRAWSIKGVLTNIVICVSLWPDPLAGKREFITDVGWCNENLGSLERLSHSQHPPPFP